MEYIIAIMLALMVLFLIWFVYFADVIMKHVSSLVLQQRLNQRSNDRIIELLEHIEKNTHKTNELKFPKK